MTDPGMTDPGMTGPDLSRPGPHAPNRPGTGAARGVGERLPGDTAAADRLPVADAARCRQVLRDLLRPQRGAALVGLAALLVATAAGLLVPPLLGRIVDVVAGHRPDTGLTRPVAGIALAALIQGLLTPIGLTRVAAAGETVLAGLRERFLERALLLPPDRVEQAGSGDLTSRVTTDVTRISEAVREAVPDFVRAGLTIALTLLAVAALDWRFLPAVAVAAGVQFVAVRAYLRRAGRVYAAQRAAAGQQQQHLLETISGAATVRAFRLADRHLPRVASASSRTIERTLDGVTLQTTFATRLNLAEFVGLAGVLGIGFVLVRDGAVSVGTAATAAFWLYGLFTPVGVVLFLIDEMHSAAASLARLVGVVDLPGPGGTGVGAGAIPAAEKGRSSEEGSGAGEGSGTETGRSREARPGSREARPGSRAAHPGTGAGPGDETDSRPPTGPVAITLERLGHTYQPGHPVLADIEVQIPAGHRVAVVGASGAGKTTLARLIAGVHRPTSGSVRLGDQDLAELDPVAVRRAVALVTQEVHVFAGRLSDDLRLARPGAREAELLDALEQVQATDWVQVLPHGPDTVVGAGGHPLTAAQAQQVALARLILTDPGVAVLDEATAEAGSAGARTLERAAEQALAGRTAVVVAHRLAQAVTADRVLMLAGGRITEQGTHAELLSAGGDYAKLWEAWSRPD